MRWNRSCTACKRRKIKCSKGQPCTYCERLHIDCIYLELAPRSGSAQRMSPASSNHSRDTNSRFVRIEALLTSLDLRLRECERQQGTTGNTAGDGHDVLRHRIHTAGPQHASDAQTSPCNTSSGREEVTALEDNVPTAGLRGTSANPLERQDGGISMSSMLFQRSLRVRIEELHPDRSHAIALWRVYKASVDPLLKIFHVATIEPLLTTALDDLANTSIELHALMLSIYYAAGTSMRYSVTPETLPFDERRKRFSVYERGVLQALEEADVLRAPSVMTLQALTLYLTCAQIHGQMPYIWPMAGLLLRLGMKVGLHRANEDLIGIEGDTQKRLWAALIALDFESSLATENDLMIDVSMYDMQLVALLEASHTHDAAIAAAPLPTDAFVAMLFPYSRLRIIKCMLDQSRRSRDPSTGTRVLLDSEAMHELDLVLVAVEQRCLQPAVSATAIAQFTAVACRIIIARLKIKAVERTRSVSVSTRSDGAHSALHDTYESLQQVLRTDPRYNCWAWILDTAGTPEFAEPSSNAVN